MGVLLYCGRMPVSSGCVAHSTDAGRSPTEAGGERKVAGRTILERLSVANRNNSAKTEVRRSQLTGRTGVRDGVHHIRFASRKGTIPRSGRSFTGGDGS